MDEVCESFVRRIGAVGGSNGTSGTRNNATSNGVLILAKGIADSDDLLTNSDGLGITKLGRWEVGSSGYFQKSDVIEWICCYYGNICVGSAFIGDDIYVVGTTNDMFVGENITIFADDNAGAGGGGSGGLTKPARSTSFCEDGYDIFGYASGDIGNGAFGKIGRVAVLTGILADGDRLISSL